MRANQVFPIFALAAATLTSAHFSILYPPPNTEPDHDMQNTGPCGGLALEAVDSTADAAVDQFALSIRSSHPEGSWTFRATNSLTVPYNWTNIAPLVETVGVGDFCLTMMSAPSEWAGSGGAIQAVDASGDGTLYACTPVNFVEGANTTVGAGCTNSSSEFTASYAGEAAPAQSDGSGGPSGTMSMSSGASATAGAADASSSAPGAAAAMATGVGSLVGGLVLAAGLAL